MESRKMVLKNLFTGQQQRNRYREETYGHGERVGESEMYEKSNMGTYITICKTDIQREFAIFSGNSNWGSVSTQSCGMGKEKGGRLKRERIYVHLWLIHIGLTENNKFCKAIIPQLKKIIFFKVKCTGKTQRDRMGRKVRGEIGMGNTCKSMADSCQCMAKITTIL